MTTIAEMLKRLAQARDRAEFNNRMRGFGVFNSRIRDNEMLNALDDLKDIAKITRFRKRMPRRF